MERLITVDVDKVKKILDNNAIKLTNSIISTVREYYIPKDEYENRLKADLEAILVELQLEIEEKGIDLCDNGWYLTYNGIIQERIDALKAESEGMNDQR